MKKWIAVSLWMCLAIVLVIKLVSNSTLIILVSIAVCVALTYLAVRWLKKPLGKVFRSGYLAMRRIKIPASKTLGSLWTYLVIGCVLIIGLTYIIQTVNVLPVLANLVAFGVLAYLTVYYYSKRTIFWAPSVAGEIKVATKSGVPDKFFGEVPPGPCRDNTGQMLWGDETRYIDRKTGIMMQGELTPSLWYRSFGVEYIGFPPYTGIYKWTIKYVRWKLGPDGQEKLEPREKKDETTLHVRPTFGMLVMEVELSDKIRLNVEVKYTLDLVDAMAALFSTNNWTLNIESALKAGLTDFLKMKTFDEIFGKPIELVLPKTIKGETKRVNLPLIREMMKLNKGNGRNPPLWSYGFVLRDLNITGMAISASQEDVVKATTALAVAKKQALATIETARGAMEAVKHRAEGVRALREALGDEADQIGKLWNADAIAAFQGNALALGTGIIPTHEHGGDGKKKGEVK